ncbi:MAG TPA: universal stress protein [Roseiarcus sp.]|nr:universal stress protein [Roseiarcus sp.]
MLDNFLVVLEDDSDALIPYAISVAKALDAQPVAVWPRRDAIVIDDGSLDSRVEAAVNAASARRARAHQALETFALDAKAAGIVAEALYPDEGLEPSLQALPRFARAFDFTMVQQREAGRAPRRDDLTAALLAESGRPVWVVPAIQRAAAKFSRVLVAWDGGAAAAEAFSESKRILKCARHVEIVSVVGPATDADVIAGGERLAARVARAGVVAQFRRLPSDEDPANALLSYAADTGADLMVCGGYSHSRLRETLFGGATRTFLTSMTLPVFFAH